MKAYVFEGTPEEIAETLKAMGLSQSTAIVAPGSAALEAEADSAEEEREWRPLPIPVARRVLSRIALAEKPKMAILAVYNSGDAGMLGSDLCKRLKYSSAQFRGMMGAFGRRIANTKGWEDGMSFFRYEWDAEDGYRYFLPDECRAAVEAELMK